MTGWQATATTATATRSPQRVPPLDLSFSGVGEKLAVVELDEAVPMWGEQPATNPQPSDVGLSAEHLAYVIYTSGSTGLAKGVMVEHRQLVNYVTGISERLGVEEGWSYGLVSTFAADLGHTAIFSSLLGKGVLHVLARAESMDGERFGHYCRERRIDCVKITPTHFQALLGEGEAEGRIPDKCVVFGGELLTQELVNRVRSGQPGCRIYNHYGPTECTVGALSEEVGESRGEESKGAIGLGRPLGNVRVYVMDGRGEPAPVGVVGEIYIAGEGVGRGYLNGAAVTGDRFVVDPYGEEGKGRMYKTGDLGRRLGDGRIEFEGRNDFQVKVRGYRVEPGEIEALLAELEELQEVAVIAREDTIGAKRLVAYYTSTEANGEGSESIGVEQLRRHLSAKLPEYMVPAAYVRLEKLPLTPNGKLDRKALPPPEGDAYGVRDYEEPVGEKEMVLAEIWEEVLKVERVGRRDNFFELGGHSLLIMKVITRLRKAGLETDVRTLFATPVLAELAAGMEKMKEIIL